MMTYHVKYDFGTEVYLKTDIDQNKWIVTDIDIKPGGLIIYTVSCGNTQYGAYDFELSETKNMETKLGINNA